MTLQSEMYYWVTCDGCEASAQENSDYTAMGDPGAAYDEAVNRDWLKVDGKDLCDDCLAKLGDCTTCGHEAIVHDLEGDNGDICQDCAVAVGIGDDAAVCKYVQVQAGDPQ